MMLSRLDGWLLGWLAGVSHLLSCAAMQISFNDHRLNCRVGLGHNESENVVAVVVEHVRVTVVDTFQCSRVCLFLFGHYSLQVVI